MMHKPDRQQKRPHHLPELVVTRTALQQIRDEVLRYPAVETAWINYGMLDRDRPVPKITMLGILTTKETEHAVGHTAIGGEGLAPKMEWLKTAFTVLRGEGNYPPESEFLFLFKGHSHHQYFSLHQSWQDTHSTLSAVIEDGVEFAFAPIAILTKRSWLAYQTCVTRDGLSQSDIRVSEEQNVTVTIRFYYYSRALYEAGARNPVIISPGITEDFDHPLPLLWMYSHEEYFANQMKHFEEQGYSAHPWKQEYPEGLRLYVSRPEWKTIVAINTPWDYPHAEATFQITPKEKQQNGTPCVPEGFSERFADVLLRLEQERRV
jgi:hypothetical protein